MADASQREVATQEAIQLIGTSGKNS